MKSPTKIAIATLAWLFTATCGAWAQDTLRAAAVVNDEIVSMLDVGQRMKLAILSTGLKDTPELRQRLLSQVVRGLIDERLQAQEAERLSIEIPEQQIAEIPPSSGSASRFIAAAAPSADAPPPPAFVPSPSRVT